MTRQWARKPIQEDLLGATWPDDPLEPAEVETGLALGMDPDHLNASQTDRWRQFRGPIRQEIARLQAHRTAMGDQ